MVQTKTEIDDKVFMELALAEARAAAAIGEVPVGAVVVAQGKVLASASNRREIDASPSAHAEFLALLKAAEVLGRWRLSDCTVYVTLEPCIMCAGLMHQARIARCVYGAADPKAGALGSLYSVHEDTRLNHTFEVESGVCVEESAQLLSTFFAQLRQNNKAAGNSHQLQQSEATASDDLCAQDRPTAEIPPQKTAHNKLSSGGTA